MSDLSDAKGNEPGRTANGEEPGVDFDELLDWIDRKIVRGRFPRNKLYNRLEHLGLREFIGGEPAIHKYGFPFKFVNHLDEAIMAMAHYLDRFRREGGRLNICAINRLPKGEDKTLSYWQSEKARLYIELQNLILLLNGMDEGMESHVTRIFAFRKIDDFAFLAQSAISVITEQVALGIEVGLMFLETFSHSAAERLGTISDTLVVDFEPGQTSDHIHNYYELRTILDESKTHDLPYHGRCSTRWFRSREDAELLADHGGALLSLFETKTWEPVGKNLGWVAPYSKNTKMREPFGHGSPQLAPAANEEKHFKRAAVVMYKAFKSSKLYGTLGFKDQEAQTEAVVDRINRTVVTSDLIRLERAISAFEESKTIYAVDPTSIKNSLKVHEAEPTYRRWIRTSLNGVLKNPSKSLNRIYILDDRGKLAKDEFQALKRIMHYYLDYCNYDVPEMTCVVNAHRGAAARPPLRWLRKARRSLRGRLNIYITTSTILEDFSRRTQMDDNLSKKFAGITGPLPRMLEDILGKDFILVADAHEGLRRLDYLYTDDMVYNFVTQRADLSELKFEAHLYRKTFKVDEERKVLFNTAAGFDDSLQDLERLQTPYLLEELASSVHNYAQNYRKVFLERQAEQPGAGRDHQEFIGRVEKQLLETEEKIAGKKKEGAALVAADATVLLDIRRQLEERLYQHFHPSFAYLYRLLEFLSVRVDFFPETRGGARGCEAEGDSSIDCVFPFSECGPRGNSRAADAQGVERLTALIRRQVDERLGGGPQGLPKPPSAGRAAAPKEKKGRPTVFISYASEDRAQAVEIADGLKAEGYDPWLDKKKLSVGGLFPEGIEQAIESCDFFIPCLSKTSVQKRGVVQEELALALAAQRRLLHDDLFILPVRLDGCKVPRVIAKRTHADLYAGGVWNEEEWDILLRSIREGLGKRGLGKVQRSRRHPPSKNAGGVTPRSRPARLDAKPKKR